MAEETSDSVEVTDSDIVFECEHCGKSLTIDERGAGLMIECPDCQARVQVPGIPEGAPYVSRSDSGSEAAGDVGQLRAENLDHLEAIGKELVLIQAALDRIVSVLQDAQTDNAPEHS